YATLVAIGIFKLLARMRALPFRRQALIALILMFAFSFVFDVGFQLIRTVFGPQAAELTVANTVTRANILRGGLFWFVPFCLWAAAMLALLHNDTARRRERQLLVAEREASAQAARVAEAETRAARSELAMLRLQLNPHFMCNALNSVSGLVLSGQKEAAVALSDALAAFLRSCTDVSDGEITLEEELETVEAYLKVQTIRFGARLNLTFDCEDETLEALIPNFILQPLVENAIKYAVIPSPVPVEIVLSARREGDTLLLAVSDDGKVPPADKKPQAKGGVGHANTRARLQIRYGGGAVLETGPTSSGYRAAIRLPFRVEGQDRKALAIF
ncbi:MAG TPA: histidine kinase, partial [Allosphingosinicella sp.]